jgi:cytochrome d ubiquinol oxidase subunit II
VLAVVVLAGQGAGWLAFRAGGELGERARVWARRLVPLELVGLLAMIGPTYAVRHHMLDVFGSHPWTVVLAAAMLGALGFSLYSQRAGRWERAFIGTSLSIAGLIASMSAGIYPYVLPAHQGHQFGLTVTNAVGPHHGLVVALIWFPIGIALALGYSAFSYRLLLRSPPA